MYAAQLRDEHLKHLREIKAARDDAIKELNT